MWERFGESLGWAYPASWVNEWEGVFQERLSLSLGIWHPKSRSQPVQYWELTDQSSLGNDFCHWGRCLTLQFCCDTYATLCSHRLPQLSGFQWGCRSFLVLRYQETVFTFVLHIFVGHCGHFKIPSLDPGRCVILKFSTTLVWLQPHICRAALLLCWAHQDQEDHFRPVTVCSLMIFGLQSHVETMLSVQPGPAEWRWKMSLTTCKPLCQA